MKFQRWQDCQTNPPLLCVHLCEAKCASVRVAPLCMFKRVENGFSTWMLFSLTRKIPLYSIVEKPLKRTPSYFTPILHGPFTAATSYRAGTPQTIPLNTTYPSSIIPPRPPINPTKRHETSIQNRTLAVSLSSAVAVPGSSHIFRRLYTKLLRTG